MKLLLRLLLMLPLTPAAVSPRLRLGLGLRLRLLDSGGPTSLLGKNPLGLMGGRLQQHSNVVDAVLKVGVSRPPMNSMLPPKDSNNSRSIRREALKVDPQVLQQLHPASLEGKSEPVAEYLEALSGEDA